MTLGCGSWEVLFLSFSGRLLRGCGSRATRSVTMRSFSFSWRIPTRRRGGAGSFDKVHVSIEHDPNVLVTRLHRHAQGRAPVLKRTKVHIVTFKISLPMYPLRFVCMCGMHICVPSRMYPFPCPLKAEITLKLKMLMLFLYQNFTLFKMA